MSQKVHRDAEDDEGEVDGVQDDARPAQIAARSAAACFSSFVPGVALVEGLQRRPEVSDSGERTTEIFPSLEEKFNDAESTIPAVVLLEFSSPPPTDEDSDLRGFDYEAGVTSSVRLKLSSLLLLSSLTVSISPLEAFVVE